MKKISLLMVLIATYTSLLAQNVKFSSATPESGKPLKFSYDPRGGQLNQLANVTCVVKALSNRDNRVSFKVKLTKVGSNYEGEFTPKDSTHLVVLIFSADGTTDENPSGYFTKIYKDGMPTPMGLFLEGHLYSGFGAYLAKIKTDQQKAASIYTQAFKADPELKEGYFNNYLLMLLNINKTEGEKRVYETIAAYNKEESEKNSLKILTLYNMLKNPVAIDSMQNQIKKTYPKGDYALSVAIRNLRAFKAANEKVEEFNRILKDFGLNLDEKADMVKLNWAFTALAESFSLIHNNEKTEFYLDKFEPKLTRAIMYNNFAKKDLVNQVNLTYAAKFSKKSLDLIDELKKETMPLYYESTEEYLAYIGSFQAAHRITYVKILSALQKYEEALAIAEMAVKSSLDDPEMNQLYVSLLAKNGKSNEVIKFAEQFILAGQGNENMKAELKSAYKGIVPFDQFYAKLVQQAHALQQEKFLKEMITVPAPKFALLNVKGQKVDLALLKGKVVIIDYWATWCGPCMASFPAMQLAVDKYKTDPNVVFLFINTWERGNDREKNVNDWIKTNPKYTFNVLLDTKSKDGLENYEVVEKYKVSGIPTKFIVDGNGNIRFKKVGFAGTAETGAGELEMMIELAKSESK